MSWKIFGSCSGPTKAALNLREYKTIKSLNLNWLSFNDETLNLTQTGRMQSWKISKEERDKFSLLEFRTSKHWIIRGKYAKLLSQPISAPVRIQDRFTSSVWNFWLRIADVSLCVSHVVEANERQLYLQVTLYHFSWRFLCIFKLSSQAWKIWTERKECINIELAEIRNR